MFKACFFTLYRGQLLFLIDSFFPTTLSKSIMASQPAPPNVPSPEIIA